MQTVRKPYTEERPWGRFERFIANERSTVKILHVNPNAKLSLQFHNNREEIWKILEGHAKITIGDGVFEGKEGDEFHVPKKTRHRIETGEVGVKILEISLGEYDEDDIVRIEDIYNRI